MKQEPSSPNHAEELHIFNIGDRSRPSPITSEVTIEGIPMQMEADTGTEISLIAEKTRKRLLPKVKLTKSNVMLKTYFE